MQIITDTSINKNAMYLNGLGKKSVKMKLNRLKCITILETVLNVVLSCDSFFGTHRPQVPHLMARIRKKPLLLNSNAREFLGSPNMSPLWINIGIYKRVIFFQIAQPVFQLLFSELATFQSLVFLSFVRRGGAIRNFD